MNPMLKAALRCTAAGWPVFRCRPNAKVPLIANPHPAGTPERKTCRGECGLLGHGYLDATTDPAVATRWWTDTPRANIGVACGAPGPDVVDIDTKNGAQGLASFDRLHDAGLLRGAHTFITTPSGGFHLYFVGTAQANGTRARHGVDFRTRGGYVLVPPSVVDGRPYVLDEYRVPAGVTVDWSQIVAFLDPPRPERPPFQRSGPLDGNSYAGLIAWLQERPAGDRNSALFWACTKALENGADDQAVDDLRDAVVRAGHSPRDAQKTADSARRARAGATR